MVTTFKICTLEEKEHAAKACWEPRRYYQTLQRFDGELRSLLFALLVLVCLGTPQLSLCRIGTFILRHCRCLADMLFFILQELTA